MSDTKKMVLGVKGHTGEWHPFAVRNSALRHFDKDGKRASRH